MGRTCRGAETKGRALLILLPSEKPYLQYLRLAKVSLNEYEFPLNKLANIEEQYMKLINRNYYLNQAAHEGYRSYLHVNLF